MLVSNLSDRQETNHKAPSTVIVTPTLRTPKMASKLQEEPSKEKAIEKDETPPEPT